MYNLRKHFILSALIVILINNIYCQNQPTTQIDIIFDASGSMWGQIEGKNKITIAKEVMEDLITDFELKKDIQLSLRVYGHLNKKCDNSVLEVPMGLNSHSTIIEKVKSIQPLGKTPIAYSLLEAVNDFDLEQSSEKVIILVTDGIESCDGNICEASLILKDSGIITNIHVVGFGMKEEEVESLKCIAEPFNGKIIGASDAKELKEAFNKISDEVSNEKNIEIVGLDMNDNQVYMDVDIYQDNEIIVSSEGTIAKFLLSKGTYRICAKSRDTDIILQKNDIVVLDGEKIKIELVFAEGKVKLNSVNSANESVYAFYTFYDGNGEEVFNTQGSGYVEKTIIPGIYNIKTYEQDTYSTLWEKDVQINPGETTEIIFSFAMGKIQLTPQTTSGNLSSEYWWYEFYNTETNEKQKVSAEGVGIKEVEILPDNYSIKVIDGYNNEVVTVNNINVDASSVKKVNITVE